MAFAQVIVLVAGLYVVVGAGVGAVFALRGVNAFDPVASSARLGFRLTILPASALLWPIVLRWMLRPRPLTPESTHRAHPPDRPS